MPSFEYFWFHHRNLTPHLGKDVVHGLGGAGIIPAEDAEQPEHLDLEEGIRDAGHVVLRGVAGHDQVLEY